MPLSRMEKTVTPIPALVLWILVGGMSYAHRDYVLIMVLESLCKFL